MPSLFVCLVVTMVIAILAGVGGIGYYYYQAHLIIDKYQVMLADCQDMLAECQGHWADSQRMAKALRVRIDDLNAEVATLRVEITLCGGDVHHKHWDI